MRWWWSLSGDNVCDNNLDINAYNSLNNNYNIKCKKNNNKKGQNNKTKSKHNINIDKLTFANLNTPKLNKLFIKKCNAINYNFCNRKYLHKRNYLSMISSYSNLKYDDYDFN